MRISQESAFSQPATCMATAVDTGDITSPYNNIHPRDKDIVAARLTRCARKYVYNDEQAIVNYPSGRRATEYNTNGTQV